MHTRTTDDDVLVSVVKEFRLEILLALGACAQVGYWLVDVLFWRGQFRCVFESMNVELSSLTHGCLTITDWFTAAPFVSMAFFLGLTVFLAGYVPMRLASSYWRQPTTRGRLSSYLYLIGLNAAIVAATHVYALALWAPMFKLINNVQ